MIDKDKKKMYIVLNGQYYNQITLGIAIRGRKVSEMERGNGRSMILQSAAKVFADKGYEGARVDEIAKEAKVTKSLLYYHFKSKEEIFEVLVEHLFHEYEGMIEAIRGENVDYESDSLKQRMRERYFPFGIENEDLIRCAFIESLKRDNYCKVFFQMVELQKSGDHEADMEKLVLEYFFNILPSIAFLCQKEAWCDYFQLDGSKMDTIFLEQYDKVHGSYHRSK